MNTQELQAIAQAIVVKSKGILAADESDSTIARRLQSVNVKSTEDKPPCLAAASVHRQRQRRLRQRSHPVRRDDPAERGYRSNVRGHPQR